MSKMLDVSGWREFKLSELFSVERGTRFVKEKRKKGTLPLATAGVLNQGIAEFVAPDVMMKEYENHLTIDMFCNCFYRGYKFICDDNILVLFARDDLNFNEKSLLYVATIINLSNKKFDYTKQYRQKTFEEHIIILPITKDGQINFKFMENTIKQTKEKINKLLDMYKFINSQNLKNSHRGGGLRVA